LAPGWHAAWAEALDTNAAIAVAARTGTSLLPMLRVWITSMCEALNLRETLHVGSSAVA
jgi:hypothetical protein